MDSKIDSFDSAGVEYSYWISSQLMITAKENACLTTFTNQSPIRRNLVRMKRKYSRAALICGARAAILRLSPSATVPIARRRSCPWCIKPKRQKKFTFVVANEPKRHRSVTGPITHFDWRCRGLGRGAVRNHLTEL